MSPITTTVVQVWGASVPDCFLCVTSISNCSLYTIFKNQMGINPQRLYYVYQHVDIHFLILLNGYTIFHYTFLSTPL